MGGDIKGKIWGGNNLKNEIMPQDIYTVFSAKEKDSRIIFHLYFHRLQLLGFEKTVNSSQIVYNNFHLSFFHVSFFFFFIRAFLQLSNLISSSGVLYYVFQILFLKSKMTKFIRDHTVRKSEIVSKQSIYRKKLENLKLNFVPKINELFLLEFEIVKIHRFSIDFNSVVTQNHDFWREKFNFTILNFFENWDFAHNFRLSYSVQTVMHVISN